MHIDTKIVLWVYGGNSPTLRIMEDEVLFTNMQEKHVAQVTGTITRVQISNTNRQQFTNNDSNSTFNSAQLTGFPARTADKTPKSFQSTNTLPLCDPSAVLLYSARQAVTSHGILDLSTVQAWPLPVIPYLPL
ncbi:hypothetical protein AVEN_169515-1 [Araneus ventricosus]|uniref:Uncharacterized protein n=1 Tax=Araneus ventricosus TaxID=182803 RepID=A0A4Y2MZ42_ARAVE|nr:hypothetical protein AVEN_169515-1 [Araneus ventricosus]